MALVKTAAISLLFYAIVVALVITSLYHGLTRYTWKTHHLTNVSPNKNIDVVLTCDPNFGGYRIHIRKHFIHGFYNQEIVTFDKQYWHVAKGVFSYDYTETVSAKDPRNRLWSYWDLKIGFWAVEFTALLAIAGMLLFRFSRRSIILPGLNNSDKAFLAITPAEHLRKQD